MWLKREDLKKYLSMDDEDMALVQWRSFKRRLTPDGWEYDIEDLTSWLAERTEEKLKRDKRPVEAEEEE